jgi:hypothetical protein
MLRPLDKFQISLPTVREDNNLWRLTIDAGKTKHPLRKSGTRQLETSLHLLAHMVPLPEVDPDTLARNLLVLG